MQDGYDPPTSSAPSTRSAQRDISEVRGAGRRASRGTWSRMGCGQHIRCGCGRYRVGFVGVGVLADQGLGRCDGSARQTGGPGCEDGAATPRFVRSGGSFGGNANIAGGFDRDAIKCRLRTAIRIAGVGYYRWVCERHCRTCVQASGGHDDLRIDGPSTDHGDDHQRALRERRRLVSCCGCVGFGVDSTG